MTNSHYQKYKKKYEEYRKKNREKHKKYMRTYRLKRLYGGYENRQRVFERDNWSCVECGMTNKQHKQLWERQLSIDHIDGNGRNSKKPNNEINNLQVLCLRCHGKKDVKRKKIHGRPKGSKNKKKKDHSIIGSIEEKTIRVQKGRLFPKIHKFISSEPIYEIMGEGIR